MKYALVLAFTSIAGPLAAQERYGFVAMLGHDTISVERIMRTVDHLVSDEVERFPRVIQRHSEFDLAADGSIRRMTMDITMPSAVTPKWHTRHFVAEYGRDSVRITIQNGEGVQSASYLTHGALTMPWSSQMYSLTELYFAAALQRHGSRINVKQFYPDLQIEDQGLNEGFVRAAPGGKAEVFDNDGLAGTGEGTLDAQHRMLSYSGARTTYKMEVTRVTALPDFDAIAAGFIATEHANGISPGLSVRDTARGAIGSTTFAIDYGRPLARGRTLVGDVIPYTEVWRTGANAATQFTTSARITVAGLRLDAGTYTLWTQPTNGGATLIVNRQTGQWGTQYDRSKDLGRAPLLTETAGAPVEKFTISVVPADAQRGTLVLEWGSFRWTAPIVVTP